MDIYTLLDSVPNTLRVNTINYLMDFGRNMQFDVGDVVFREGDRSTMVYIILDGEANVIKGDSFGNSNIIATASKGSIFGEMGVFLNLRRSGSIVAKTPLSVLAMKNEDFISALQHFPDLSLKLFKSLSLKLNSVNENLADLLNSMTMVQLGSFIMAHSQQERKTQTYKLETITEHTDLQRRDLVNALINYNRMGIIDNLQFKDEESASFRTHSTKLLSYLERISLNPKKS